MAVTIADKLSNGVTAAARRETELRAVAAIFASELVNKFADAVDQKGPRMFSGVDLKTRFQPYEYRVLG
jgi:hypothetical protein